MLDTAITDSISKLVNVAATLATGAIGVFVWSIKTNINQYTEKMKIMTDHNAEVMSKLSAAQDDLFRRMRANEEKVHYLRGAHDAYTQNGGHVK